MFVWELDFVYRCACFNSPFHVPSCPRDHNLIMVPCEFRLMASLLFMAAFALLTPLGSTNPLANVNTATRHQETKNPMISVIVVADTIHPSGAFRDRARVEVYGGSRVAAVQFKALEDVGKTSHVQGRSPFNKGHPEGVERSRVIHFSAWRGKNIRRQNTNQVSQTFVSRLSLYSIVL